MGCIICNLLAGISIAADEDDYKQRIPELKEEICNDIAVGHPEMVTRINQIRAEYEKRLKHTIEGD